MDVRREAWSQRMVTRARLGNRDPHRNTLHDLGEISRCIVGREERELRSRRAAHARHQTPVSATMLSKGCPGDTSWPISTCFLETSPEAGAVMRV